MSLIDNVEVEKTNYFMPYATVMRVRTGGDLVFISGATALPLYHQHPHEFDKLDEIGAAYEVFRDRREEVFKVVIRL